MLERLLNFITLGRVTLVDDQGDLQRVQITRTAIGRGGYTAVTDNLPRVADYGFASVPPDDADAVIIHLAGRAANGIVIATSHKGSRQRNLKPGDVAFYDNRGHVVRLTSDGIAIEAAGDAVTITNASKVRCNCDIETEGDVIARVDGSKVSLTRLHDVFNLHVHPPTATGTTWGAGPPKPQA